MEEVLYQSKLYSELSRHVNVLGNIGKTIANADTSTTSGPTNTNSASTIISTMSSDVVLEPNVNDDRTRIQVISNIKELSLNSYSE